MFEDRDRNRLGAWVCAGALVALVVLAAVAAMAGHFMVWEETQHRTVLETSKDWLLHGSVKGVSQGVIRVDSERGYHKQ